MTTAAAPSTTPAATRGAVGGALADRSGRAGREARGPCERPQVASLGQVEGLGRAVLEHRVGVVERHDPAGGDSMIREIRFSSTSSPTSTAPVASSGLREPACPTSRPLTGA